MKGSVENSSHVLTYFHIFYSCVLRANIAWLDEQERESEIAIIIFPHRRIFERNENHFRFQQFFRGVN